MIKTVSVTDHKLVRPNLARVIIAWSGSPHRSELKDMLCAKLQHLAAPVEGSFRKLSDNTAIGFIRANRAIRELDAQGLKSKALTARYKVMSSNILMDNQDRSLWELRNGPGGNHYIARHGHEDLTTLIEAASSHGRSDVPRLGRITMASAASGELASFCTMNGSTDYGFVIKAGADSTTVVSSTTGQSTQVPNSMINSLHPVRIDRATHEVIKAKIEDPQGRAKAIDYWRELFSYAPDYMEKMIHYVEEDTVI